MLLINKAIFNPLEFGNCQLWLDFNDLTTISQDTPGLINQLRDKSGNLRHANQATLGNRPSVNIISPRNNSVYNGTSSALDIANSSLPATFLTDNFTIALNFNIDTLTVARVVLGKRSATNNGLAVGFLISPTPNRLFFDWGGTSQRLLSSSAIPTGQNVSLILTRSPTARTITINGSLNVSGSAGTANINTTSTLTIGYSLTNFFAGRLNELIMYSSALASNQIEILSGYLNWKWLNQSNLPSNHPYFSSIPR